MKPPFVSRSSACLISGLLLRALSCLLAFGVSTVIAADAKPKRLLIIGQGPDGHPPTTHEFMPGVRVLAELLKPWKEISTTIVKADEPWPDGPKLLDGADGIALFVTQGAEWMQSDEKRFAAVKRLGARGGAISAFHWSVGAKDEKYIQGQLAVLGGTRGGPQRKYIVQSGDLKRVAPQHPVLAGMKDFTTYDEFYYRLDLRPDIQPLYTVNLEGRDETIAWAWDRPDGGRSFGFVCLHFHGNWQMPEYRRFCTQGVLWTLKLPVPAGGVGTDIDSNHLALDGVLPPIGGPAADKAAKDTRAKQLKK
jgi:hypothetical protein